MAEIHVERKPAGGRPLIWLGALVVVALLAWAVMRMRGPSDPPAPAPADTAAAVDSTPAPAATAAPAPAPAPAETAPGIVGDDTSGVPAPADSAAEGRLGNP